MSFTTLENVRMFLSKPSLDPDTELPLIELLIRCVGGVIENYCGWPILAKSYIRKYSGDGTKLLDLGVHPLNVVTSCMIGEEERIGDVTVSYEDGELYMDSTSFTSGTRNITVTFNAGYINPPQDLVYAATWMVCHNYRLVDEESIGVKSESFQKLQVDFDPGELPPFVQRVLDRYKKVKVY